VVITRTPLRIGLVGGGSDIDSFARRHGGATLSVTIDRYVTVFAGRHSNGVSVLTPYEREDRAHAVTVQNGFLREALRTAGIATGIRLVTAGDVPKGGTGLGTSSAVRRHSSW
jgi:D-glycero-alpha-D-manno-heptose-7-phosphate kinase